MHAPVNMASASLNPVPWVVARVQQLRGGTKTRTPSQGVRMRGEATISSHTALVTPPPSIHNLGVVGGAGSHRGGIGLRPRRPLNP